MCYSVDKSAGPREVAVIGLMLQMNSRSTVQRQAEFQLPLKGFPAPSVSSLICNVRESSLSPKLASNFEG